MTGNFAKPADQELKPEVQSGRLGQATLAPAVGRPAESLVSRFEEMVRKYPGLVAVTCDGEGITYKELSRSADGFAGVLSKMGLGRETIVAIYLDRSISMVSAMLGVLKAGCAYLPIDPTYPSARVVATLEDAAPAVVITEARLLSGLPPLAAQVLTIGEVPDSDDDLSGAQSDADYLAYVMYTSGSTGKPKGVLVTHGNVMRLMTETESWFHFDENDVWTMFHSFAFDFSVWEIWGPLLTGGRLVIVSFEVSRSTEDFYALISEQRVTVLNQTPSAFMLLDEIESARVASTGSVLPLALRFVIFGGEALQYRSLRNWFRRHGDQRPRLINMYGITETTVHVTYRIVTESDAQSETDSLIGEPIADLRIHLLDADGHPVVEGEDGEMWIGGGGVARGYLNRPELTAQRFVPDTFSRDGGLLYRSGDLARRRADGQLLYLGRNDHQVKINGFRIELGEVEAAVAAYPGVRQVAVIAHTDHAGNQRLAAYFVADGANISAHQMRGFLTQRSPAQMVPAFYTQLSEIPLTHNGKVDRKALPAPVAGSGAIAAPDSAGGSPMQERVAAIWREMLHAPNVGIDDNFFDIGGSSVLLIRVRTELQRQLSRQIPITWMFEFTTIRTLADKLGETESGASTAKPASASPELSAAQQRARRQREAFAQMRSAKGGKP